MTMPKPINGENKDDFLLRCMGDRLMNRTYPEKDRRYAAAANLWEARNKSMDTDVAKRSVDIYVPFQKSDDELRMVYGICTSEAVDSQGEIVTKDAIRKAWDGYMEYGNIREMHQPSAVGVTKEFEHSDDGTWIGVKVVDDIAWNKVKEGVYKGFSIGGRVLKKNKNIISELVLYEISLVDRPANPEAKFSAVKVDTGLVDQLELEINSNDMKKYVEIDGVKYVEDPENPGQPLVDEAGENVPFVDEEEAEAPAEPVAPAEEPVATAVEPEAPVEPVAPAEAPAAVEPEDKESAAAATLKKVGMPTAKDSMGVITLASLLDHATYIEELFEMNGKPTTGLDGIIETIKSFIAMEAGEPDKEAAAHGDLAKALGGELAKAIAPVMEQVGTLAKSMEALQADVEAIKGTKVSPRPVGSVAVEKSFEAAGGDVSKGTVALRRELEEVDAEINKFADEMRTALASDPGRQAEFTRKADELHGKRGRIQRQLTEAGGIG